MENEMYTMKKFLKYCLSKMKEIIPVVLSSAHISYDLFNKNGSYDTTFITLAFLLFLS